MPTREYAEFVSLITETIEQVLNADPMITPESGRMPEAESAAGGPAHAYLFDFEKIVWHYPDAPARLIEE